MIDNGENWVDNFLLLQAIEEVNSVADDCNWFSGSGPGKAVS
jgi:hypothetical protein